jgi:hypothetical protein
MATAGFELSRILGSLLAGAALTFARCVTINGGEDVQHTSAGGRVDAVTYLAEGTVGNPASLAIDGVVVVECGGTVADGDPLVSGANGRVVVSTDNNCYLVALEAGAVGEHIRALLMPKNTISAGLETIVNTPGAISLATKYTKIEPTGTDAMTLAAGLYDGQEKFIQQGVGASTPVIVITGDFEENGTAGNTLTLNAAHEAVLLVWDEAGTTWQVMMNIGSVALSTV